MYKITEQGRSMIEMLGVLAIIGVLSIGGLHVINRMQYEHKATQLVNDFNETVTKLQKSIGQMDSGYKNISVFAYKNNLYSTNWVPNQKNNTIIYTGLLSSTYKLSGSSDAPHYTVYAMNVDDNICIRLAMQEFPNIRYVFANDKNVHSKTVKLSLENVTDKCNKGSDNQIYFMFKNLDRYLSYYEKNDSKSLNEIVALVNVNRDKDYYKDLVDTDTSKGTAMLVNKYHALTKDYQASDIVKTSATYSYANNELNSEAYEAYKNLAEAAKADGYTILILSSYRDYEYQDKLWNQRKQAYGTRKADDYAARAGSSEHETGYAIDVADFYDKNDSFKDTESYQWMLNNAHKYGFILRYPEDKEEITGYKFESWHYRYLGVDLATKVYNEGITFDEYYEFYLNN